MAAIGMEVADWPRVTPPTKTTTTTTTAKTAALGDGDAATSASAQPSPARAHADILQLRLANAAAMAHNRSLSEVNGGSGGVGLLEMRFMAGNGAERNPGYPTNIPGMCLERATSLELATSGLGSRRSTN